MAPSVELDSPYPWAHLAERLWRRFLSYCEISEQPDGCWTWKGAKSRGGGKPDSAKWYTTFNVGRWAVRAHIFVAVVIGDAFGRKMRPGMHVDHLCENTLCVHWRHLEVTTPTENSLRRWGKAR